MGIYFTDNYVIFHHPTACHYVIVDRAAKTFVGGTIISASSNGWFNGDAQNGYSLAGLQLQGAPTGLMFCHLGKEKL